MIIRIRHDQMEELEDLRNEYPYAFHTVDMTMTEVPWHWHEALEFEYIREGSMRVSTTDFSYTFCKGEGFFVNSNILTKMDNIENCRLECHLFHPVFLSGHFKSVFETKYLDPVIQNRHLELVPIRGEDAAQRQLLAALRELSRIQEAQDQEFQTRNKLSEAWLLLLEAVKQGHTEMAASRNQDRMLTMLAFVHSHYAEKMTLEDIAQSASVSPRECLRCFNTSIRQSPMEYLIAYRIRIAKKLLETTDLSVTEISGQSGFNSPAYFTKQFHRICGVSPRAYRKERQ